MKKLNPEIISILRCRRCEGEFKASDTALTCKVCGSAIPVINGFIDFLGEEGRLMFFKENTRDLKFQMEEMTNSSTLAKAYHMGSNLISCDYIPFRQLDGFLSGIGDDKVVVELGSGNRRLHDHYINVDIFPFANVDILSDIKETPFGDMTVDYIVIDAVLEHVPEPHAVVGEIFRILKPGGKVFCLVPFIHPYHGYPKNYFNISKDGLLYLFRDFDECIVETYRGPTSAMINLMAEYAALAFSKNEKGLLYTLLRGGALLPIFIFKYLDRFWNPTGPALRISNALCAIVTK